MKPERYREVNKINGKLTQDELDQGYHFCGDWDEDLIGPGMSEYWAACVCGRQRTWVLVCENDFAGNMLIFWKRNAKGYTANIDEAHRFTKDEAFRQHKVRETDVPWPVMYLKNKAVRCVDSQLVNHKEALNE